MQHEIAAKELPRNQGTSRNRREVYPPRGKAYDEHAIRRTCMGVSLLVLCRCSCMCCQRIRACYFTRRACALSSAIPSRCLTPVDTSGGPHENPSVRAKCERLLQGFQQVHLGTPVGHYCVNDIWKVKRRVRELPWTSATVSAKPYRSLRRRSCHITRSNGPLIAIKRCSDPARTEPKTQGQQSRPALKSAIQRRSKSTIFSWPSLARSDHFAAPVI